MPGLLGGRSGGLVALVATLLEALLTCAAAQGVARPDTSLPAGRLQGSVVTALTTAPIDDALISISPVGGGAMPGGRRSAFWEASRTTRTDASGVYRFDGLPPGRYQMHVQRIGFRSADVEVDLGYLTAVQVSVGLSVLPIVLEPVTVRAVAVDRGPSSFGSAWDSVAQARVLAEAERRRRFLATDTRSLTGADLIEAVTLGETDLFRALQRVAGVTTRDEFTAELWTRGGRWSDTRVTYDGLPLFSPLHVGGAITGIPPDVVGSALFHPGVRPAASGEGAAAALELRSRPGGDGGVHGRAELSAVSAQTTVEGGAGRDVRWLVGARRSYIDLVSRFLAALKGDSSDVIRYAFTDVAGRLDLPLGTARAVELSGLWSSDALGGSVSEFLSSNRGRWGNLLLRATAVAPLGHLATRHTVGVSRYHVSLGPCPTPCGPSFGHITWNLNTDADLTYVIFASTLRPAADNMWSAGVDVFSQRLHYVGAGPFWYSDAPTWGETEFRGATDVVSLWGERRARVGEHLTLQAGLRVDAGSDIADAASVRLAPRLQARYALLGDDLLLAAGVGRSFQYSQAVGPLGPGMGPQLRLSEIWILAGDTVPAVRAEIVTAGAEYWLKGGGLLALNLYWRGERGVALADPTLPRDTPVIYVLGTTASRGFEISLRRLTGRWTGSASLAVGRTDISARSYRFPAPTQRQAVFQANGLLTIRPTLRVGGAVTLASGAPFTRYVLQSACYDDQAPDCPASAGRAPPYVEAPGAARTPALATVDVLADWNREYAGWSLGVYLQLRNVLRATRAAAYTGSMDRCAVPPSSVWIRARPGVCDGYERGLPLLPLAGVRVSF